MKIAEVTKLYFQTNVDKHWIKVQNQGLNSEYRFWSIDRFHCHATKKSIGNCPVEEAKKMKCQKRLIYKQFVQV